MRLSRGAAPAARSESVTRLLVFGRPRLEVDGRTIPAAAWRAQRAFQMLIYLALHPRGASRDALLESFWPGRQAAAGRRNFHPTLSYVRHVLPKSSTPILHEAGFYRLNPEYPLTCDAWEFERRLAEASGARGAERRPALEAAVELASGAFLDGLYVDWADALQTRMRDRLEKALSDLGELRARDGEYESALQAFRRAAELDGFREPTRLAVIECLLRLGNRRAAINEYEKLKETLRTELGVDPMPDTEETVRRLMAGKGRKEWPGETPPLSLEPQGREKVGRITQAAGKRPEGASST